MFPITYQVDLCEGHDCQCLRKLMTIHCKSHKRVHGFMMIDVSPLGDSTLVRLKPRSSFSNNMSNYCSVMLFRLRSGGSGKSFLTNLTSIESSVSDYLSSSIWILDKEKMI